MRIKELIEELEAFPEDTQVFFSYDYGDHCHTDVAEAPECVELRKVTWSDYHDKHKLVDPDRPADDEEDESFDAVVLKADKW